MQLVFFVLDPSAVCSACLLNWFTELELFDRRTRDPQALREARGNEDLLVNEYHSHIMKNNAEAASRQSVIFKA